MYTKFILLRILLLLISVQLFVFLFVLSITSLEQYGPFVRIGGGFIVGYAFFYFWYLIEKKNIYYGWKKLGEKIYGKSK